jgi:hypothetical protein
MGDHLIAEIAEKYLALGHLACRWSESSLVSAQTEMLPYDEAKAGNCAKGPQVRDYCFQTGLEKMSY